MKRFAMRVWLALGFLWDGKDRSTPEYPPFIDTSDTDDEWGLHPPYRCQECYKRVNSLHTSPGEPNRCNTCYDAHHTIIPQGEIELLPMPEGDQMSEAIERNRRAIADAFMLPSGLLDPAPLLDTSEPGMLFLSRNRCNVHGIHEWIHDEDLANRTIHRRCIHCSYREWAHYDDLAGLGSTHTQEQMDLLFQSDVPPPAPPPVQRVPAQPVARNNVISITSRRPIRLE